MAPGTFKDYERKVVVTLLDGRLPASVVESVLESVTPVSLENTGAGYFLTAAHPDLPKKRMVCNEPLLIGRVDDVECGFVIFLGNGELTLECHSFGEGGLPTDLRGRDVHVERA